MGLDDLDFMAEDEDVELRVDVLQAGRTFASATTSLHQDGKERARAMVLLTAEEPDLIRHASTMPDVPAPEEVAGSSLGENVGVVADFDIMDAEAVNDPRLQIWARWPDAGDQLPISQGLLAHGTASVGHRASREGRQGQAEREREETAHEGWVEAYDCWVEADSSGRA